MTVHNIRQLKPVILGCLILLCSACAYNNNVVVGTTTEAIDWETVTVFYNTNPECMTERVAYLSVPGERYSRVTLINGFRQDAARLGAPMVKVTHINQIGSVEYSGQAEALRCIEISE